MPSKDIRKECFAHLIARKGIIFWQIQTLPAPYLTRQ
jgi:hypothetical protein